MPPALATSRGWNAQSPGSLPGTPTAITEHAARLHEPSKNSTPTQLACPLRSRYVWTGGSHAARMPSSPSMGARLTAGRASGLARPNESSRQPERRYSSFEAYVVDGEVLDGETGWTSPSNSHYLHRRAGANAAAGSSGSGGGPAAGAAGSGPGSSLRPGGRSSLFFGADYSTLAGTAHAERAESAAARLPSGTVDPKAAALLGIAGSVTGVPSKAQKLLGVGKRAGEEGRAEVLALQDAESPVLSSGANSRSPRKDEAPPGLAPLGVDEDAHSAPGSSSSGRVRGGSMVPTGRADVDVQVAFPPDFDASRKGASDSDDGDKARSGTSLGTKSGSTSLLSMMSGSPRSLGTAHDSAEGSPSPRTPLSDHLSSDENASSSNATTATAVAGAPRSERVGSRTRGGGAVSAAVVDARIGSRGHAHEPWSSSAAEADQSRPDVGVSASNGRDPRQGLPDVSVGLNGAAEDDDDTDLPSAHPTPLSVFGGDGGLPSDHPTPLSVADTKHGDAGKPASAGGKSTNPSSSTFMQRLKYWGGVSADDGAKASGGGASGQPRLTGAVAAAVAAANGKSQQSLPRTHSGRAEQPSPASSLGGGAQTVYGAKKTGSTSRSSSSSSSPSENAAHSSGITGGSTRYVEPSSKPRLTGSVPETVAAAKKRSIEERLQRERQSHSTAEQPSPVSSLGRDGPPPPYTLESFHSSEHGVKVVPYDSVTSDAVSQYSSSGRKKSWRGAISSPLEPKLEQVETRPASRHRQQDSRDDLAGLEPLGSSSSKPNGEPIAVTVGGAPSSSASAPVAGAVDTASGSVQGMFTGHSANRWSGVASAAPAASMDSASCSTAGMFPGLAAGRIEPSPVVVDPESGSESAASTYSGFGAAHRAELAALRMARGTPAPGDASVVEASEAEDEEAAFSEDESDMDWDAASAGTDEDEKKEELQDDEDGAAGGEGVSLTTAEKLSVFATPHARGLGMGPALQQPQVEAPAPPYMAIVEAANVTGALDNSSTSEVDTSPSEDDGGMMAEILTDRLMEVCSKMESVAAPPAAELSDGEVGGAGSVKRRPSVRRRQLSNMSSTWNFNKDQGAGSSRRHGSFFSTSGFLPDGDEKMDSDEESIRDDGATARKLRRDRLRKRSRAQSRRNLSAALTVPTDPKGQPINVHTAAYDGHVELLSSYISQGGDLEARDQFQATALMLASERGHTEMVDALLSAGADTCDVDENGNSALHLACFYGNREVVRLLLSVDVDVAAVDAEGRTPLDLATDSSIRRMVRTEEVVRMSGESFDLIGAVEVNDTMALDSFLTMGQEACGYPGNSSAIPAAAKRLRLDRQGRGGMTAVHLAAFHGYSDALRLLLEGGADPNAVCDDGETPLHTACTGGSTICATLLLEHGANPLATDAKGLVPCEKHIAGGRTDMKHLLETKAFQATPANLMALRSELAEIALQIDAEEDLFVRKGVAIKYLRKALKKKEADTARLRQAVDARDTDIRNLGDRMESVHRLLVGVSAVE